MSYINLRGTRMTDADLADLSELTDVDVLDLSDTRVSDAGLRHLQRLTRLVLLMLDGTEVTPKGVEELRGALPGVTVLFTQGAIACEEMTRDKKPHGNAVLKLPLIGDVASLKPHALPSAPSR
jgi:hypothetical protein